MRGRWMIDSRVKEKWQSQASRASLLDMDQQHLREIEPLRFNAELSLSGRPADAAHYNMTAGSQMNDYGATLFASLTHCREIIHNREQDNRVFFKLFLFCLFLEHDEKGKK